MAEKSYTISLPEGEIILSTGKIATLAAGSVMLRKGGTVVLAAVTIGTEESEQDFFPLSVEYAEKMYASGSISGSRFLKREGFPSEDSIIRARQVDHSIRTLFPKGFKFPVTVIMTVLAHDGENDPEALTVLGASAALMISGAPFFGPASSVVAGVRHDGEIVLNPSIKDHEELMAEFVVSAADGKVLNIEGWSKEVSEEKMDEVLDKSLAHIALLNAAQVEFAKDIAKPTMAYSELPVSEELIKKVKESKGAELKAGLFVDEKSDRNALLAKVRADLKAEFAGQEDAPSDMDIYKAVDYIARKIMRTSIMEEGKRFSSRGLEEIRPLKAEVDVLPTVHGSALFSRGLTQALAIVTLGSTRVSQVLEDVEGERTKGFMHHYNMPGYTTGEANRYQFKPGRREIGHGAIGENALKNIIANQEEFPYTIRAVSEIMTSNGSTSMAATCASSMALMAAGVPMKGAVGGIGVGLITEDNNEDNYKLLLDIEGVEDFYGDMDFKVTGTTSGITAIQFETKLKGVKPEVLKKAFRLAKTGREQVIEVMNTAIATSRGEVAANAPRVEIIQINPMKIGELIGPGGKNIRSIIEEGNTMADGQLEIDINDDGRVTITAVSKEQRDFAFSRIMATTEEPEIGRIYNGTIDKVMPYGAFVDMESGMSGLIHVSELADGFVKDPSQVVKEGQDVKVKLIKIENGKLSFSIKQAQQGHQSGQSEE
jgi:polyribonucleotide nucleotidyltransferase